VRRRRLRGSGGIREALVAKRRALGDAHPSTLVSISNLSQLLQARGDLNGAEPQFRRSTGQETSAGRGK
jgi:hypothetical protein